jgi:hypothetical protein
MRIKTNAVLRQGWTQLIQKVGFKKNNSAEMKADFSFDFAPAVGWLFYQPYPGLWWATCLPHENIWAHGQRLF